MHTDSTRTEFGAYVVDREVRAENDLTYYWVNNGEIHTTLGGYAGKLLHGKYIVFYNNGNLKIRGEIKKGLQHNEWRYFDAKGKLKIVRCFKNGALKSETRFDVVNIDEPEVNEDSIQKIPFWKFWKKKKKTVEDSSNTSLSDSTSLNKGIQP
jgi:antitoxin component YwqK of YwqJK toxin-antitoxin module